MLDYGTRMHQTKNVYHYMQINPLKSAKNSLGRFLGVVSGVRTIAIFLQPCARLHFFPCLGDIMKTFPFNFCPVGYICHWQFSRHIF